MITNQQYHRLMNEHQAHGNITVSALKSDTSRPTARKYVRAGKSPAELQAKHVWRTRPDPLSGIWPQAEVMLVAAPELEAKALFEHLSQRCPGATEEEHLRTFQRRGVQMRRPHGPPQEGVFSPEASPPPPPPISCSQ